MKRIAILAIAGALLPTLSSIAQGEEISLVAHLLGSTQVPASQSDAFAEAQFSFDSGAHTLQYYVNYDGIAPAQIDIHGPASEGANAPSLVNIPVSESPVSGSATLTPDESGQLLAGKLYIDIHSRTHPDGEIRGQIVRH